MIQVVSLDPTTNVATLSDGRTIKYEKCLIATGGTPRNHTAIENAPGLQDKTTRFRSVRIYTWKWIFVPRLSTNTRLFVPTPVQISG